MSTLKGAIKSKILKTLTQAKNNTKISSLDSMKDELKE